MADDWQGFIDAWFEVAMADEARDAIAELGHPRPRSKTEAGDLAHRMLAGASGDNRIAIADTLLALIRADGIKQWAKLLTGRSLNKGPGMEAILAAYFATPADDDRAAGPGTRDRRSTGGERALAKRAGSESKASRSNEQAIVGRCLKCEEQATFEHATGQNLAAAANLIKDLVSPLSWLSVATRADATLYRCMKCRYLQKVCSDCNEIVDTTASQCSGCGHPFA